MRFLTRSETAARFEGKRVAIVGSGPGVLDNPPGLIDGHDIVVRVNNYKLSKAAGLRTHVFYSFFGNSIRKPVEDLKRDGVTLCMCKCPDGQPIDSEWHRKTGRMEGVDFRWIYAKRKDWWFCDTYIPSARDFLAKFDLLGRHVPTTGFAAILDILSFAPAEIYLTGFDFFASRIHNVNERWNPGDPADPIGHAPQRELAWLTDSWNNVLRGDRKLMRLLERAPAA